MAHHTVRNDAEKWDIRITAKQKYFELNLAELWRYRDLLTMFIKKDIVTVYKQTILGPIWFVMQPILTALVFMVIFSRVARLPTGNVPPVLFYLGSLTLFNYFSETFRVTSKTFSENATVFGKVYFPRLILPMAKVISGVVKLMIQFALFFLVWGFYLIKGSNMQPNWHMVFFPVIILLLSLMCFGFGILVTSFTTKYRDLNFLIAFGVQLWMYITPVLYPITIVSKERQIWFWLNPLTSVIEAFKYGFFGRKGGEWSYSWLLYSTLVTLVMLFMGIIAFNKVEKKFIDTV
ncbi:MAG: ABC transporter permease [Taibaiella sp.]|nr:ABC transporter permease [Taibaiella sp.]